MNNVNLTFTSNAALKVAELIADEENQELNLRVSISGGGCSGFQYGFMFDDKVNSDDIVVQADDSTNSEISSIRLVVDPISYQYLVGAEVDFESNLQGEQFVVKNPNANTTCGCGNSFSA